MLKRLIIFLAIVFSCSATRAQFLPTLKVTALVSNGITNFPDTIYEGVFYTYSIVVQNTDLQNSYTNSPATIFAIHLKTDTLPAMTLYSDSSQFTIAPGDTIMFTMVDTFPSPSFKLGNNVVVVWPSVTNGTIPFNIDSTYFNIYYVGITGINELSVAPLQVYPNPFYNQLDISHSKEGQATVCIYDAQSKLVMQQPFNDNTLDVSYLKEGLYFVELKIRNKVVARGKVIKGH